MVERRKRLVKVMRRQDSGSLSECQASMLQKYRIFRVLSGRFARKACVFGICVATERTEDSGKRTLSVLGLKFRLKAASVRLPSTALAESGLAACPRTPRLIVSLTSYPKRIPTVRFVIASLLTQEHKPDAVVLWLGEDRFPHREHDLPADLLNLRKFGLTIEWCRDVGPYTKLIPALRKYPDDVIVTCDDDTLYPTRWLQDLYRAHLRNPRVVQCHLVRRIAVEDGRVLPYGSWQQVGETQEAGGFENLLMGVGGVLYPPHALASEVLDEKTFLRTSPTADDLWFWAMAVKAGSRIARVSSSEPVPYEKRFTNDEDALFLRNLCRSKNDGQFEAILSHEPIVRERLLESSRTSRCVGLYFRWFRRGGTEKVVATLAWMFRRMGWKVAVFSEVSFDQAETFAFPPETAYVTLTSGSDRNGLLARELKALGVSLWYTHQCFYPRAMDDHLLLHALGVPVLAHLHMSLEFMQAGGRRYFSDQMDFLRTYVDLVLVLRKTDSEILRRLGGTVRCIPNPIAAESVAADVRPRPVRPRRICWIGRLDDNKRPEEAVAIFKRVLTAIPDAELDLVCGRTADEQRELEELVASSGAGDRIRLSPFSDSVAVHYRAADVLLMTSRWECFPMVAAEAAASGIPIVSYDIGDVALFDGNRGVARIPQGDVDAAARTIGRIFDDPELWGGMSEACRRHVRQFLDFDFEACYSEIVRTIRGGVRKLAPCFRIGAAWRQLAWRLWMPSVRTDQYRSYVQKNGGRIRRLGRWNQYVADPFPYSDRGISYVFYETLNASRKGVIGCFRERGDGHWEDLGTVLESAVHLSYPQVFSEGGRIYMIPESCDYRGGYRNGEVALYEAEDFPRGWKKVATLVQAPLSDATLLRKDGRYYLAGMRHFERTGAELWHADSLRGPWSLHPQTANLNPSRRLRRCGGAFRLEDGRLYRIAQDCNGTYGKRVFKVPVRDVSEKTYLEGPAELLLDGMRHTYNTMTANGGVYELTDRRFLRFYWWRPSVLGDFLRVVRKMAVRCRSGWGGFHIELFGIKFTFGAADGFPALATIGLVFRKRKRITP